MMSTLKGMLEMKGSRPGRISHHCAYHALTETNFHPLQFFLVATQIKEYDEHSSLLV
jgi:hypothetical protein